MYDSIEEIVTDITKSKFEQLEDTTFGIYGNRTKYGLHKKIDIPYGVAELFGIGLTLNPLDGNEGIIMTDNEIKLHKDYDFLRDVCVNLTFELGKGD